MEPWWPQANDEPFKYRDPASVASLISGSITGDIEARNTAAGALSRVVKALEDEPIDDSHNLLQARLPELLPGLVHPDSFLQGQTISILRRIRPDLPAVTALLALRLATPPEERALVTEALGLTSPEAWSESGEQAIAEELGNPASQFAAAHALYSAGIRRVFRRAETLAALAQVAVSSDALVADQAIFALTSFLPSAGAMPVKQLLLRVAQEAPERVRIKVAESLGWWPCEAGRTLLGHCLADPSPQVQAAAQAALVRIDSRRA